MRKGILCAVPSDKTVLLFSVVLFFALILISSGSHVQARQVKAPGGNPTPEAAVPAILAAFDTHEIVAIPAAHGMKDVDDFILSLIRNPAFPEKVNDIEVECGNSLYQTLLDRYIAGEDVPFTEVQKVWRNTTQPMCGTSGFYEQFFALVRAINQKLPAAKRLRVLAGDPPIDWDQVKNSQDIRKFFKRDDTITTVLVNEVLAKHRKALMLFGLFHLMHGGGLNGASAVSMYEKDYPNLTVVISDLQDFEGNLPDLSGSVFAKWPTPSLARFKGTWLGAMDLSHFYPAPLRLGKDCKVRNEFPESLQKPIADLVDAFLYLGPQNLRLEEKMPADIAVDTDYTAELQRRAGLMEPFGPPIQTSKEMNQEILNGAAKPLIELLKPPDTKAIEQSCLERKDQTKPPQ